MSLSLFIKEGGKALTKKGKEALKALQEMERGVATRAGGKKAQGLERIPETTTRNLGKGFGLKDPKTGKMATKEQRAAVAKSGRKREVLGGGAAIGTGVLVNQLLSADEEATKDTKQKTGLKESGKGSGKSSGKSSGKGSGKSTGAKTESKTFRERRLARMKKRLEDAENEGRKRRLKRRITRVEGRIEDAEDRRKPKKKNMGGMMKSKMASKGGKMGGKMNRGMKAGGMAKKGYSKGGVAKQGANDRLDESLGMRRGKESTKSQSMKSRRDESRGSSKKSTPQSAGVAKRGWGAVMK